MEIISTKCRAVSRSRGFTIIELMVAITVLGLLLGVGVPAFNDIIRNNRVAAQANELVTAISLARSEASKRGVPVSICAAESADQDECAADDEEDWQFGWLVFSDRTGTPGVMDAGDELLQASQTVTEGLELTADTGFIRFGADGSLMNGVAAAFSLQHQQCRGDNLRRISISSTGRASLVKEPCE